MKIGSKNLISWLLICTLLVGCSTDVVVDSNLPSSDGTISMSKDGISENVTSPKSSDDTESEQMPSPTPEPSAAPDFLGVFHYEEGKFLGYVLIEKDGDEYKSVDVHYSNEKLEKKYGYSFDDFRYEKDEKGKDIYSWDFFNYDDYMGCDSMCRKYERTYNSAGEDIKIKETIIDTNSGKYKEKKDGVTMSIRKFKNGSLTDIFAKSKSYRKHDKFKNGVLRFQGENFRSFTVKRYYDSKGRKIKVITSYPDNPLNYSKVVYKYDLKDSSGKVYYIRKHYGMKQDYDLDSYEVSYRLALLGTDEYYEDENGEIIEEKSFGDDGCIQGITKYYKQEITQGVAGKTIYDLAGRMRYDGDEEIFELNRREVFDQYGRELERIDYESPSDDSSDYEAEDGKYLIQEKYRVKYIYDRDELQDESLYKDYTVSEENVPEFISEKWEKR